MIRAFGIGHKIERAYSDDPDPDTFTGAMELAARSNARLNAYARDSRNVVPPITTFVWTPGDTDCACPLCPKKAA